VSKKRKGDPAPRLIAVEGPIGVGKTTLARFLAERLGGRAVLDPSDDNPFLAGFYEAPRRHAFQAQMYFLLARYQQQQDLKQEDLFTKLTVVDYVFQKDRVFAELALTEDELALYDRVYRTLDPRVPTPDLVVYLQARTDVLLERIRARNREMDRALDPAYLDRMVQAYASFFFGWQRTPLLVINTSDVDFVEREADLETVLGAVRRMRRGTQYFNPGG
jgi:deoxyguanosine kinase